jgi:hypothetical protein
MRCEKCSARTAFVHFAADTFFCDAQRLLAASEIRFLPSTLSLLLFFVFTVAILGPGLVFVGEVATASTLRAWRSFSIS